MLSSIKKQNLLVSDRQINIMFELNEATVKKVLKRILQDAIMIGCQSWAAARANAQGADDSEQMQEPNTDLRKWSNNNTKI